MANKRLLIFVIAWLAIIALWFVDDASGWKGSFPWLHYPILCFGLIAGYSVHVSLGDKKGTTKLRGCGLSFLSWFAFATTMWFARPLWEVAFGSTSGSAFRWGEPWVEIGNWVLTFGLCFGPPITLVLLWRGIRGAGDEREGTLIQIGSGGNEAHGSGGSG